MTDPTSILSAVASCIAAAFAGGTLYIAGRREERRWRRDATVDALVVLLDASFAGAGQGALDASRGGEDLRTYRAANDEAHQTQLGALTRLRLIADSPVVQTADRLHHADRKVRDAVLVGSALPSSETWAHLRARQRAARAELLDTARASLGLTAGPEIIRVPPDH
jgi:hypothetical protein